MSSNPFGRQRLGDDYHPMVGKTVTLKSGHEADINIASTLHLRAGRIKRYWPMKCGNDRMLVEVGGSLVSTEISFVRIHA